ncbi:MAG: zinc ribbon domain-containing protein [Clostridiaceae bacterium]|nr:zinc ribbon domain-containing protein [Clostridiaceae bacterium]
MKKCTQCGADVLEGEKFCGNCGNNLMVSGANTDEEIVENIQENLAEFEESDSSHLASEDFVEEDTNLYSEDSGSQSYYQGYEQQYTEPNYQRASIPYSYPANYVSESDLMMPSTRFDEKSLPKKYKPISTLAYLGYGILFGIPLVGLILAIVFAVNDNKINRRNYARSVIIIYIIILVLATVGFFVFKDIIYSLIAILSML